MNALGLCPSYDRLQDIITALGNRVAKYYNDIEVVCPPQLQLKRFTIGAVDNTNYNPSSNIYVESFNGTSISLFQNITNDTTDSCVTVPELDTVLKTERNKRNIDHELPDYYTNIIPLMLPNNDVYILYSYLETAYSKLGSC